MKNRISKADRTKAFIIEKASDLFNIKGYSATTLADIIAVTGLSKGCIYGNFENKEEIALAAFDYSCRLIFQLYEDEISDAYTYHERLIGYAKVHIKITKGLFKKGGRSIRNIAFETDETHPLLKKKAALGFQQWQRKLELQIEGGIATGEFKKNAAIGRIAFSIISIVEGGLMVARTTDDPMSINFVLVTVENIINQIEE